MPDLKKSLGFQYLQQTKLDRQSLVHMSRPRISPAAQFKSYPEAESFKLPGPELAGQGLQKLLLSRRSRRKYRDAPLHLQELAALLWAAQGISGSMGRLMLRTSPSAGALYPLETYLVLQNVPELPAGIFHLEQANFFLELLQRGDFAAQAARACLDQGFMAQAQVNVFWSGVLRRNMCKYGHRGLRYVLLDAGHVCQNLLLAAEDLGLAACPVGAFFDQELDSLFALDGEEESVIYAASLGRKA
ncbi:MAG: SagB/ThcOx family dehydrogenase [Desulfohalobiaceae bacterium]